jgi:hypothetical protein
MGPTIGEVWLVRTKVGDEIREMRIVAMSDKCIKLEEESRDWESWHLKPDIQWFDKLREAPGGKAPETN